MKRSTPLGSLRHRYEGGLSLAESGQPAEALRVFDALLAEAGDAGGNSHQSVVANATLQKGEALSALGRNEQAVEACLDVEHRYGDQGDRRLRLAVCRAMLLRAHILLKAHLVIGPAAPADQPIEILEEIIARFGDSRDKYIGRYVAQARVAKAWILGERGRMAEASEILDGVLAAASGGVGAQADVVVVSALAEKGSLLEAAGDFEAALGAYREARHRAAQNPTLGLERGGLVSEGRVLQALGRHEEALAAYDAILKSDEIDRPLRRWHLIEASKAKANLLWKLGRRQEALLSAGELTRLAEQWGDRDLSAEATGVREWMLAHDGVPDGQRPSPPQCND